MSSMLLKKTYLKTTVNDIFLPDAPFTSKYLPANFFSVRSDITHCKIPWMVAISAYEAYTLSGGISSTIVGAAAGISAANSVQEINSRIGNFSVFGNHIGPQFGYCIENRFKQHVYIKFDIMNDPIRGQIILLYYGIELLENGRFERIYVKEGEIVSYSVVNNKSIISLGIDKLAPPPIDSVVGGSINILNSSNENLKLNILGIDSDWNIIVSTPPATMIPKAGDYYYLDQTWCIQDPYLLTGFWEGNENSLVNNSTISTSGLDLYKTQQNSPYEESYITGVYIWKEKPTGTASSDNPSVIEQPISGSSMNDTQAYEWAFCGYGNSAQYSDTYPDDVRYKEEVDVASNVVSGALTRMIATEDDISALLSTEPPPEYLRVELGKGGYYSRNNWHAPCLKGCYLNYEGEKFKIIDHIESNIIDLAVICVGGNKFIDINGTTKYSILNQHAWMIVENYYDTSATQPRMGIMEGKVTSSSGKQIVLDVSQDPIIVNREKGGISLKERYQTDIDLVSSLTKLFTKQENWRLLDSSSNNQYAIDKAVFGSFSDDRRSYQITVTLKKERDIRIGDSLWFAFGEPYDTVRGRNSDKKNGSYFSLTARGGASGERNMFLVSDRLCLDGYYDSVRYKMNLDRGDVRVGICDGLEFGIDANNTSYDRMGVFMYVYGDGNSRGIASFFHTLRQEGWIAYQDADTDNLTIRKGLLDFKESPVKSEVVLGKPVLLETIGGGTAVSLNSSQERLRRISVKVPKSPSDSNQSPAIIFGIGDIDTTHGFLISGDGLVDLQMLRYQGIDEGEVSSDTYTDSSSLSVSPVYVYKKGPLQAKDYVEVDMAIDTSNSIYFKDADSEGANPISVDNVVAQYINNNQIIKNKGIFDIIRKPDGEILLIYDQTTSAFTINSELNNSQINNTQWNSSSAVYIIGSTNDGYRWETPNKFLNSGDIPNASLYQYSIMLLNGVEYLSCILNPNSGVLSIFVRAYSNGYDYIGCYSLVTQSLDHTLYLCEDEEHIISRPEASLLNFFYRPPLMDAKVISNKDVSWITDKQDIISSPFKLGTTKIPFPNDKYIRVLGAETTNSQVIYDGDFRVISTSVLRDGTYMLIYNATGGIRAIFSTDQGQQWVGSNIILARNGFNGITLGDHLVYLTSDGIIIKNIDEIYFLNAIKKGEGNSDVSVEIQIQKQFDDATTTLFSETISNQRLSGYISVEKYYRIFFYDANNRLKCIGSQDGLTWGVVDNF